MGSAAVYTFGELTGSLFIILSMENARVFRVVIFGVFYVPLLPSAWTAVSVVASFYVYDDVHPHVSVNKVKQKKMIKAGRYIFKITIVFKLR